MKLAIVLIGYDRPHAIRRLYESIRQSSSEYPFDLIFSIDKSPVQKDVADAINSFGGEIERRAVRQFSKRLGLRKHVMACGDLTEDYDAVIVLEDDIVVSDVFIDYAVAAVKFVNDDVRVAGISLYAPSVNEMAMLPFIPKRTGFDNYYLQSAQSWGQCWTRRMWQDFRKWYAENSKPLEASDDMPGRIYSWPESSWKKYFMKYLVDTGKTFFYPYDSLSSNCSDVGQHNREITPYFQVPLVSGKREFCFGRMDEVPCYDIFFERMGLEFDNELLCLDLYGTKKTSSSRFLLTPKKIDAPIVCSFGLTYRPQEDNYLKGAPGDDIFLYDLMTQPKLRMVEQTLSVKIAKYHTNLSWRHSLIYGVNALMSRVLYKIKS